MKRAIELRCVVVEPELSDESLGWYRTSLRDEQGGSSLRQMARNTSVSEPSGSRCFATERRWIQWCRRHVLEIEDLL
ncbi:MAG: hypothetical protein ACYC6N_22705 [Pirellulaceae bacterium]